MRWFDIERVIVLAFTSAPDHHLEDQVIDESRCDTDDG